MSMMRRSMWFVVIFSMTGYAHSLCHGRFLNPVTDINWDMIFPIRIAGVALSHGRASTDSHKTVTSPLCICPSRVLGIPMIGVMVTYHQPLFIEEIVKTPGCLPTLGGVLVLGGYEAERTDLKEDVNSASRWQVHWYEYPL